MITSTNRVSISTYSKAKEFRLRHWYDDFHRGSYGKMRRSCGKRRDNYKWTLRSHRTGH